MLALAHIPTGVTANEGLNIDEVNNRFAEQAVALSATGADIPRRMEPRIGSAALGSQALVWSNLPLAFAAAIP